MTSDLTIKFGFSVEHSAVFSPYAQITRYLDLLQGTYSPILILVRVMRHAYLCSLR